VQNTTSPAALIALAIKAHPEMTEAEIAAAIDARLTIARQIADAKCTVYEYMIASLIATQKETRSRLRQVEAERDALASWQCQTCGARLSRRCSRGCGLRKGSWWRLRQQRPFGRCLSHSGRHTRLLWGARRVSNPRY